MPDVATNASAGTALHKIPGRQVLLVEDDESVGISLAGVLEMHGSNVTLVTSVSVALTLLRERSFDVVVSDLMLDDDEGRTGFAVLAAATQLHPGLTPILITGYPSAAVIQRAESESLAGVLVKPLDIAELLALLAPHLP